MANDVRIGVKAETQGAESGMDRTDKSVKKVTRTVDDLGKAARRAASEIDKIEVSARRLERVQKILSAEMGRSVSPSETKQFLERFEAMRSNRHLSGGGKIRHFKSFEEWHAGNRGMFVDPREAERYKRRVMGMAGGGGHHPDDPKGGGGSGLMRSGLRGAMHIGGGMLALSGVMGIMSMAGRAVDMAKDEALANDQLLRSLGDLRVEFDTLQTQVRSSADGLGVAFTEAAAMAKHFAKEANASSKTDIYGNMRTGMGMARAYGFEPQVGVGFMAQMRHFGTMDGDKNGKRMALMIAEAIERGGVTAKADEVMAAVADFTGQVARLTLTAPNVAGFAGALASLTAPHIPGLDPRNAANILTTADMAVRRGGGGGEAGLNLTYGALSRVNSNLNPMVAMAIAEQGLFGSGAGLKGSPLGNFLGGRGVDIGGLSGTSNFQLIRDELNRQYGDSPLAVDAFKTYFGLGSYQQAAALYGMKGSQVGGLESLVKSAGLDVQNISATGIQNLAEIGAAGPTRLRQLGGKLLSRSDVSDSEKANLRNLLSGTDDEATRTEMARIVATREQEKNVATETRDGVAALNNTLTNIGGALLPIISTIQQGVVAIANAVAPDSDVEARYRGMNQIPEYLGKKEALEREIADGDAGDASWLEAQVKRRGENWRPYLERQVEMRRKGRRWKQTALDNEYSDAIDALKEQQRIQDQITGGSYGGDVPAGNPAGAATPTGAPIQLEVTGRLLDQMDKVMGQMDPATTVVRPPMAAGSR